MLPIERGQVGGGREVLIVTVASGPAIVGHTDLRRGFTPGDISLDQGVRGEVKRDVRSVPIAAAPLGGAQVSFRIGLDQCLHLDRVLGRWGQPARPPALFSVSLVCSPDGLLAVSESGQLSGPLSCLRSSPLLSCQAGGLGPAPSACFICRSEPGRESARTRRSRSVELEVERGERCAECRHGEFVSVPSACDRVDHKASLPGVTRSQVLTGERHARLSCR